MHQHSLFIPIVRALPDGRAHPSRIGIAMREPDSYTRSSIFHGPTRGVVRGAWCVVDTMLFAVCVSAAYTSTKHALYIFPLGFSAVGAVGGAVMIRRIESQRQRAENEDDTPSERLFPICILSSV